MFRVVRQGARWGAALVALGLFLGPVAVVNAAEEDEDAEVETEREIADIKIEVKLESGRVVKPSDSFKVDFDTQTELAIEAEGQNHVFNLTVQHKEGKKKGKVVALTVGYSRDGEDIIAPFTFDAKVKKREVLRIEGGMALAFTITPKKIKGDGGTVVEDEDAPEEPKEDPRDKIDVCDEDDPLCGVQ